MKKLLFLLCAFVCMTSCRDNKHQDENYARNLRDSLTLVINQKDAELNDIMSTFNDIQASLREINEAEGRVNLEKDNPEKNSKGEILENISFIRRTIQLNKERIARLQQQLKSSSFNVTKLKEAIEELNKQMEEKNNQIAQMEEELKVRDVKIAEQEGQINTLDEEVHTLSEENEQKTATVERQEKELNTAWYVFGTKKELKEQRILQSGDVLKTNDFNQDYFTQIDIRVMKSVKLYSKSAKLLTTHPADSYKLEMDSQKQYTLYITNPMSFWSVSRYLVILVK